MMGPGAWCGIWRIVNAFQASVLRNRGSAALREYVRPHVSASAAVPRGSLSPNSELGLSQGWCECRVRRHTADREQFLQRSIKDTSQRQTGWTALSGLLTMAVCWLGRSHPGRNPLPVGDFISETFRLSRSTALGPSLSHLPALDRCCREGPTLRSHGHLPRIMRNLQERTAFGGVEGSHPLVVHTESVRRTPTVEWAPTKKPSH